MTSSTSPDTSPGHTQTPALRYVTDTTEGSTFESPKLRQWIEFHLDGATAILNPCAGTTRLETDGDVFRVDVSEAADADLTADFRTLLDYVEPESFDAIVYDPPYTTNQAESKYGLDLGDDGFYFYSRSVKDLFDTLLAPGGLFIQFGYSTSSMPAEYQYSTLDVALFNKLGSQNDYLGTVARKPAPDSTTACEHSSKASVHPNDLPGELRDTEATTGGNGGQPIEMRYHRKRDTNSLSDCLSNAVNNWVDGSDHVLHIYRDKPTVAPAGIVTRCGYDCIDLAESEFEEGTLVETPWNIGSRFATGVFDVVVLDLPYRAFQQNIRVPWKLGGEGSERTHVDTALKRSLTNLVSGSGGRVIQLGRTATLMSGIDYDYRRAGVTVVNHPSQHTDRIVSVDVKAHRNLETAGLPAGEVDRFDTTHIVTGQSTPVGVASKHERTHLQADDSSHFCVHCGNSYYFHPAFYVSCSECGAIPGDRCTADDGEVIQGTVHRSRVKATDNRHDGQCNNKTSTYLPASEETVKRVTDGVRTATEAGDTELWLTRRRLFGLISSRATETPRSTDLLERVQTRLDGRERSRANRSEPDSGVDTTLDEFLAVDG